MKNKIQHQLLIFIFIFSILFLPVGLKAQTETYCGFDEKLQPERSSGSLLLLSNPSGAYMPSFGTIKVLMLFIEFSDDTNNTTNPVWPIGTGPNFLSDIVDTSINQSSGEIANVTTYFKDMSYDNLKMIGTALYTPARFSENYYKNHTTYKSNIPYWATRHVIQHLDSSGFDFSSYDNWDRNGLYDIDPGSDGVVDMIFACYRREHSSSDGNGYLAEGWADLGQASTTLHPNYNVDNGQRQIQADYPGSGVTVLEMNMYPKDGTFIT